MCNARQVEKFDVGKIKSISVWAIFVCAESLERVVILKKSEELFLGMKKVAHGKTKKARI